MPTATRTTRTTTTRFRRLKIVVMWIIIGMAPGMHLTSGLGTNRNARALTANWS
jgi:hypothetical protein